MKLHEGYYHHGDPNRLFPDGKPESPFDPDVDPPSVLEQGYTRLFEEVRSTANFWIDLHNTWTGFRSRWSHHDTNLHYRDDGSAAQNKAAQVRGRKMLDALVTQMCRKLTPWPCSSSTK